eukprot:1814961-Pleurochrysis_carterae.AAC.1
MGAGWVQARRQTLIHGVRAAIEASGQREAVRSEAGTDIADKRLGIEAHPSGARAWVENCRAPREAPSPKSSPRDIVCACRDRSTLERGLMERGASFAARWPSRKEEQHGLPF